MSVGKAEIGLFIVNQMDSAIFEVVAPFGLPGHFPFISRCNPVNGISVDDQARGIFDPIEQIDCAASGSNSEKVPKSLPKFPDPRLVGSGIGFPTGIEHRIDAVVLIVLFRNIGIGRAIHHFIGQIRILDDLRSGGPIL